MGFIGDLFITLASVVVFIALFFLPLSFGGLIAAAEIGNTKAREWALLSLYGLYFGGLYWAQHAGLFRWINLF